jgi:hypothetical protein
VPACEQRNEECERRTIGVDDDLLHALRNPLGEFVCAGR